VVKRNIMYTFKKNKKTNKIVMQNRYIMWDVLDSSVNQFNLLIFSQ